MAVRHTRLCDKCKKEFQWLEPTAEPMDKPGLYDVIDYTRVGKRVPGNDGKPHIIARCEHCGHENEFNEYNE